MPLPLVPIALSDTVLYVDDLEGLLGFYQQAFGLPLLIFDPDLGYARLGGLGSACIIGEGSNNPSLHAAPTHPALSLAKRSLAPTLLSPKQLSPSVAISFKVSHVDSAYEKALQMGGKPLCPPANQPWGQRTATLTDPEGVLIELCQSLFEPLLPPPAQPPDASTRWVLVTGASTGIGAACCLDLIARGYAVIATVRTPDAAQLLSQNIHQAQQQSAPDQPVWLYACLCDVTRSDTIEHLIHWVDQWCPQGLYGIINNAGIAVAGPLELVPPQDFETQMAVNVSGPFRVTQACLPAMRRFRDHHPTDRPRIVMISSISGRVAFPLMGPYVTSKHALAAMSDVWRMELAHLGIVVSLIEPGAVKTPIWKKSAHHTETHQQGLNASHQHSYQNALDRLKHLVTRSEANAMTAEPVLKAIRHALESGNPPRCIVVGKKAKLYAALDGLPYWLTDQIKRHQLGV